MKRTLFAIGVATLALAVAAPAAQHGKQATGGGSRGKAAMAATHARGTNIQRSRQMGMRQNASTGAFRNRTVSSRNRTASTRSSLRTASSAKSNRITSRGQGFRRAQATSHRPVTGNTAARERINRSQGGLTSGRNRNVTANRTRNVNRNVAVVNHWRGDRFSGRNYAAFRNYHRAWHDRGWWRSHYNHLIFVSGGWYFWNSGYWYPAWGYDPGYSYAYDGPIYGAANFTPDQIVTNVQQQLQDAGYYNGPIDGVLGSQTRYAIAAFQADHGLAVTSAVDEPTLATLGLS